MQAQGIAADGNLQFGRILGPSAVKLLPQSCGKSRYLIILYLKVAYRRMSMCNWVTLTH